MRFLTTAIVAKMHPVLTDDADTLAEYAYSLLVVAEKFEARNCTRLAVLNRKRAYYLRTLAR